MRLPAPPPPSTTSWPDTVDAGTHGHRTPTLDTGHRTSGRSDILTGHWTAAAWTGTRDAGHPTPDTGHRTLAEDTDTLTKAQQHTDAHELLVTLLHYVPEPDRSRALGQLTTGELRHLARLLADATDLRQVARTICLGCCNAPSATPPAPAAPTSRNAHRPATFP